MRLSLFYPFHLLRKRHLVARERRLSNEIDCLREELVTHPLEIASKRIERDEVRAEIKHLEGMQP